MCKSDKDLNTSTQPSADTVVHLGSIPALTSLSLKTNFCNWTFTYAKRVKLNHF